MLENRKQVEPLRDSFQIVIRNMPFRELPPNKEGWKYKSEINNQKGEMELIQEFSKNFHKHKGKIIDVSNILEKELEQIILKAKRQMKIPLKYDNFRNFTKNFTFFDKYQDFRTITKDKSFPIKKEYKQLRKDILRVISIRNKYTHGELVYDGSIKKFLIEYEEDGKTEAEVSDDILKKEVGFICNTSVPLREIAKEFDILISKEKN